jgi:hypothetical protein
MILGKQDCLLEDTWPETERQWKFRGTGEPLGIRIAAMFAASFAATFLILYGWFLALWQMHQADLLA